MKNTTKASNQKEKEWYQKPWGVLLAILLLPLFVTWYAWAKSNWSKNVKIAITVLSGVFVIFALVSNNSHQETVSSTSQEATGAVTTQQVAPVYIFDVPALIGKNIDEIRALLGQPIDGALTDPNTQQLANGTDEWDNTFKKDSQELLVTFSVSSRSVTDLFLSGDNKAKLLEIGNLKEGDSRYTIEEVAALRGGGITGIKVTPM